jgi:hypothetical protein
VALYPLCGHHYASAQKPLNGSNAVIADINVGSTNHSQILANGNELADYGTFIKTDGSLGSVGEVTGHIGDINLIDDTFHREFSDTLDTSNLAEGLPDMQGSGAMLYQRQLRNFNPIFTNRMTK